MFLSPVYDGIIPSLTETLLIIVTFVFVVALVEAYVLKRMGWGTFWQSLNAAIFANIVSTIPGFYVSEFSGLGNYFIRIFIMYLLTVALEWLVLFILGRKRLDLNRILKMTLYANLTSYALLLLLNLTNLL